MKIIYLLPPSEGKQTGGEQWEKKLSFSFDMPLDIAKNATEKDLKCKDKRFKEAIALNTNIGTSEKLPSISRYSGVMYNAIAYPALHKQWKKYFEESFLILSGMYGILKPDDMIGNYKLPIETKGLYSFWGDTITQALNKQWADMIVDFLPNAYKKMIDWKEIDAKVVKVDFFEYKNGERKKMTHGVKKVKGEYIYDICHNAYTDVNDFPWNIAMENEKELHIHVEKK